MTTPDVQTVDVRATGDGSATLYSARYGQTYHSRHGAVTESRHVFLDASGVSDRLAAGHSTRVLEVGFGTGLNVLLAAAAAAEMDTPLDIVSLEHDVLPASTLRALGFDTVVGPLAEALAAWRASLPAPLRPGRYRTSLGPTTLTLIVGDARRAALPDACDAVWLDAFSPHANPELWTKNLLDRLFHALRHGGRLATYSAKSSVRRTLQAVGFEVEKRPGPPGKREMTVATRPAD